MSTKLDADGLAAKRYPDDTVWYEEDTHLMDGYSVQTRRSVASEKQRKSRIDYAAAIREHSQPLVDELAAVKAERDELRNALEGMVRCTTKELADAYGFGPQRRHSVTILKKYPKP